MNDLIPEDMTDTAMWAVVVGFFMPLIINFVVSAKWSPAAKALVSFGVSAVVGAITAWLTGAYTGLGIPSAILLTFVVAIAAYSQFWKQVFPDAQASFGVGSSVTKSESGGLNSGRH